MTNCFTRPASGAGPLLDHGRLYAFEETIFLNKYGVCKPAVDLAALRKFLDNSGLLSCFHFNILNQRLYTFLFWAPCVTIRISFAWFLP